MFTFKNQLKNIGRSAYRYSSLACDMTQSPAPLEPEQQLAAVWGLSSPLAGTPTPARQGNAARVRTNPGQPNKFRKGLGKGTNKSPQAKRSREQEAEEEFWMDQDQLDEETIKRILRLLVRAASRHEQQLTSLEADRSYVFFLEVGHHGLIGMLVQASQAWHQQFEAGTVTTSLRATLWGVLLLEWKTRLDKIENDANALQTAEAAHWITRTPLQWTYTEWNTEQKKALPASRDNLPHEDAKRAVNRLLKSTAKGRRRTSIPESEAAQARPAGRGGSDAADPHHPPSGSGDLHGSGHTGEQLRWEADRPMPTTGTSQQERAGKRVGKATAMNDERTPPRSRLPTTQPEGHARSPPPPLVKPSNDVKQSDIFSFFAGQDCCR